MEMPQRSTVPTGVPTGRAVLVIEDEQRIRSMLSQALREMGFEATLAPTGEAGLAAMVQRAFDILILDLNLPGISGVEASRQLRDTHPEVIVVLLSSYDEAEFLDMTPDCGSSAYVPKSAFGPDRLEEVWAATTRSRLG